MKTVFERLSSRMDTAKERISEFEEISKTKKQREKKNLKREQNIQERWDTPNRNSKRIRKT